MAGLRPRRRPPWPRDPQPGMAAKHDTDCPRCHERIRRNVDRIVFLRGRPIHVHCASGNDDE